MTTVFVMSLKRLEPFSWAWHTWAKNCPEMLDGPMLVFVDGESEGWWQRQLRYIMPAGVDLRVARWPTPPGLSLEQREQLALTYGVAALCETEWFLKIDTDVVRTRSGDWLDPAWLDDASSHAFISHRWGYTKPHDMYRRLVAWADRHPVLKDLPPVPAEFAAQEHVNHDRVWTWLMIGRTSFLRELTEIAPGPVLPIESESTVLWYVAHRLGRSYLRVNMERLGWKRAGRRVAREAQEILQCSAE